MSTCGPTDQSHSSCKRTCVILTITKVILEDTLTPKRLIYGGIREDAFRLAQSLRADHGLQPNENVTIISRSCVDYILAIHAVWAPGGIVSAINHSNTAEEIAYAVKIIKPSIFIVDAAFKNELNRVVDLARGRHKVITLLGRVQDYPMFPDNLSTGTRIAADAYVFDGQDARQKCAAIALSSGTTGMPKAVMLCHHNLIAICEMLRLHNMDNWNGDMREIFFPPPSHIYGLYVCALMGPWIGSYIGLMHAFDLETFCRLLSTKRATLARLVPPTALALAESTTVSKYQYPDLRYFSCAGAVLKPNLAAKLRKRFPGVSLCQTYGCTETSSCISQSGVRDTNAPLVVTGTLLPNISIRFIDDHLQDVPEGQEGEICVSSPTVMMGYKDNQQATTESMLMPGWYRTGDVGYLDANGYLIIADRIKDVIKYKGFQVSPTELEKTIGRHPLMQDVGVNSAWDESETTEVPRAFVVPRSGVNSGDFNAVAEEIKAIVAKQAAEYKKLRGGVRFVEKLLRNPTGKLLRRLLKKQEHTQEVELKAKM